MKVPISCIGVEFEIPDEWWSFAEMEAFDRLGTNYYNYRGYKDSDRAVVVDLSSVKPPTRDAGVPMFKKRKLVPILFALSSDEFGLPPVKVKRLSELQLYRFCVTDGFHRYYASAAIGYTKLPVVITATNEGMC